MNLTVLAQMSCWALDRRGDGHHTRELYSVPMQRTCTTYASHNPFQWQETPR